MILTKKQINTLEKALRKADILQIKAQNAAGDLSALIYDLTGVLNHVDYLQGDGHGVTPICDNDTHVPIDYLIKTAKSGEDINEQYMLDNLSI